MNFSERQSLILEVLREAGRPMVGADLADLLGVSPRTLRYDIGGINRIRGMAVVVSDGTGYSIDAAAYRGLLSEAPRVASVLDDDERLLVYLLDRNECGLYDAATSCYLGESMVRAAVSRLAPRLEAQGLKLSLEASKITIAGTELDRRRMLGRLALEAADAPVGGQQRLRRLLPDEDLDVVETVINRSLAKVAPPLNDIVRQNLAVNLAICIQRRGRLFIAVNDAASIGGVSALAADRLLTELRRTFNWDTTPAEAGYIRTLVAVAFGKAVAATSTTEHNLDDSAVAEAVTRAVTDCITHFDLHTQREKLISSIIDHTRRLIARSSTLVYFRNSLRESLRTRSPYLYDVAVYLAHQISASLGVRVTDDEISLLAIYLGLYTDHHDTSADAVAVTIICPHYQTLREWLLARFVDQFGERVRIVDVVATMREAEATEGELIVTTIGGNSTCRPVVEISALSSDMDAEVIQAAIRKIRDDRERSRTSAVLTRFLDPRLFFVDDQCADAAATIGFLCDQLLATGKVPESFADSVRMREEYSSTAFAYRFAVPHSMEFIAHETAIAVLIPKRPINWGESDVVMVLLLAVNPDDYADFSFFYERLVHLLCDPDLFSELRRARDFTAFRDYLAERLSQTS